MSGDKMRAQRVAIPDNIGFEQAAALPCAYGTARRMIRPRTFAQVLA